MADGRRGRGWCSALTFNGFMGDNGWEERLVVQRGS